jgi:hypothetical protein
MPLDSLVLEAAEWRRAWRTGLEAERVVNHKSVECRRRKKRAVQWRTAKL